jgi:hypothetical protein
MIYIRGLEYQTGIPKVESSPLEEWLVVQTMIEKTNKNSDKKIIETIRIGIMD